MLRCPFPFDVVTREIRQRRPVMRQQRDVRCIVLYHATKSPHLRHVRRVLDEVQFDLHSWIRFRPSVRYDM